VLYDALADSESKDIFVKLIAFGVLGHKRVKLPLNTEQFWKQRNGLARLASSVDSFVSGRFRLQLCDLNPLGYPIKLHAPSIGPQSTFLLKQYDYSSGLTRIKAEEGDVVIDAGGCWGDTTLYFAHEVGERGKILTVECIPGNLEVLERNLKLNAVLQHRVTIVRNPLWSSPGIQLSFIDNGPSSVGTPAAKESVDGAREYTTTTIDELVGHNHLPTVDFLKMDIEGAELEALKGAELIIKKFRPKLAISVYHSVSDLVDVFEYLSSLGLGYRFFMGHYTIHWHETVLFAISDATARNVGTPD
jgi:FkbM family methyltransferase